MSVQTPPVLQDKVALILGAGSSRAGLSIGKATSIAFARAGASVIAVDLDAAAAEDVQSAIRSEGGTCEAVVADVTNSKSVKRAVNTALARFGRIDVLQNNVGVAHVGGPVEMSEDTWLESMKVNVGSAFLACKHVLPIMEAQGHGAITNISSISGQRWVGVPMIGYAAFKAALNNFTQNVALQYARANVVVVGRMDTPILRAALG
ncbi:MAG TPA: SDR family oxidoreductase, partial [Pseudonocardia sp.]